MKLDRQSAEPPPSPRNRGRIAITILALILITGALAALWLGRQGVSVEAVAALLDRNRELAAALVILLMIAHCFVPFPAELLALAAGAAFGALGGAALIWLGAMLGAALSFLLARRLGRPFVESILPARRREELDRWADRNLALQLLLCRFVPLIAFNLVNFGAGLTPIGWRAFLLTTAVGILPLTLLMTWMGAEMRTLSWPVILAVSGGALAVTLLVCVIARRLRA